MLKYLEYLSNKGDITLMLIHYAIRQSDVPEKTPVLAIGLGTAFFNQHPYFCPEYEPSVQLKALQVES